MIEIENKTIEKIKRHAEETYPEECCGALLGRIEKDIKKVIRTVKLENSARENKKRRYAIKPEDYIRLQREASEEKLDIIGFYHSHPDHPAEPSEYDRKNALPFISYLIISVKNGKADRLNSWILENERFVSEEIKTK